MLYFAAKIAALRLSRLLQALTGDIEQPTVIRTANPAVFDIAVFQRASTVRAVKTQ
jgi:hypothetical protein